MSMGYNIHRQMRELKEIARTHKELFANIGIRSVKYSAGP
jgi:hypothetical protein